MERRCIAYDADDAYDTDDMDELKMMRRRCIDDEDDGLQMMKI